ncbi:uncharacterized protein LOC125262495 isoform X2 [Megalobrama amblycephala]|uniref:uncharacterized protein LOC125262495 isoform X2 n=1 Tax=Megalobrama amblycephala TaxID=75352 RepID=UPI002013D3AB|nr:uncharacterized protein LOC125262495 isoform X2 [Megalobrama amblycephala]
MISTLKLMLALATVLGVVVTTVNSIPPKKQNVNQNNAALENQLRTAAEQALQAIGSTRTATASSALADRGQHVFNNNLLKLHRSVLEGMLNFLGASEQLNNLEQYLRIPLSQLQREAISTTMVVHFSSDEFYVDYNAGVYGAYVEKLRHELVEYLKADTSDNDDERNRTRTQVQFITGEMVNRNVIVDPMARDHWVKKDQNRLQQYNDIRAALMNMFQNILEDFEKVSERIKHYYESGKWNR